MASSDQSRPPTAAKPDTPSPEFSSATDVTTPSPTHEFFDDVFGSAPPSPGLQQTSVPGSTAATTPGIDDTALSTPVSSYRESSDIARLRTTHTTAGYREGLSAAKDSALQPGFDEGYSLGAALGMQAGLIVGIMDMIPDAIQTDGDEEVVGKLRSIVGICRQELLQTNLLSDDYIDMEGLWSWSVPDNANVHQVAAAHPLISKWQKQADALCGALGISAQKLDKRWVDDEPDGDGAATPAAQRKARNAPTGDGLTNPLSKAFDF